MTRGRRVLFIDHRRQAHWGAQPNRFAESAKVAATAGFEVTLATLGTTQPDTSADVSSSDQIGTIRVSPLPLPLVCGAWRAIETAPLRDAYTIGQSIKSSDFDVIVAPLQGGLLHGLLMGRATGELSPQTRFALWCDAPSRWLALQDDESPSGVAPLVADALERVSLSLADALICPSDRARARLDGLAELPPLILQAELAIAAPVEWVASPAPITEIVFVGPLSRAGGALLFMDALELFASSGSLRDRSVTFLGPMATTGPRVSQELVGIRAGTWDFRFRMHPTESASEILAYLAGRGRLAVFAAEDCDDDRLLRLTLAQGCGVVSTDGYDVMRRAGHATCPARADALAAAITATCEGTAAEGDAPSPALTAWPEVLRSLCSAPTRRLRVDRAPLTHKVSVCIAAGARPVSLRQAVDSVGIDLRVIEIAVLDNAGKDPLTGGLASAAGHEVRVIRSDVHRSPAQAYNLLAEAASGDALVFLDDDNVFRPGGLQAFVDALESGPFDIVVTTLDLVDGVAATDASAGTFVFVGQAGSAGLFFNAFGDRALAIRRDAFLALGGFPDPGHHAAVSDWTFLAKAQAAGLRIGVLQQPAVRYARRLGGSDTNWAKRDLEGGRRAVLEAYAETIDGPLVARFAQGLQLRSY